MEKKEDLPSSGVMKGDEVPDTYRVAPRSEHMIQFGVSTPPVAPVVAPPEAPPATGEALAVTAPASETPPIGANTSTEGKKKRGRPRKYGPDGALALSPMPISVSIPLTGDYATWKNSRGPYKKKQKLEFHTTSGEAVAHSGANFTPHIITVNAGEDVSMKILSFSQQGSRAICILSANGAISNVTLRQPNSSGGTLTYEGHFEILSLSGSFMPTDNGGTKSRTGGMSVSLAGPDGRVMGGGLAGLLVAAGPVQVVIGSFLPSNQQQEKPKKQKSELAPPFSPVPIVHNISGEGNNAVYSGPPRSITPAWYHGNNLGSGNTGHGPSVTPAPYHGNNMASGNNFHGPSITPSPHHRDNTGSENASHGQNISPAPYNGENMGSGSSTPGRIITPASYHGSTVVSGNGPNIVATENSTSFPGESKEPSPSNRMVSC